MNFLGSYFPVSFNMRCYYFFFGLFLADLDPNIYVTFSYDDCTRSSLSASGKLYYCNYVRGPRDRSTLSLRMW
jgi:hypothetical protein